MSDVRRLRKKAREAMQAGELPGRRPDRTWGGPGDGCSCTICGVIVKCDESEIEVEFAADGDHPDPHNLHIHVRCFAAWEFELDRMQAAASAATPDVASSREPAANRRRLPRTTNAGSIDGRGRDKTNKRGPA